MDKSKFLILVSQNSSAVLMGNIHSTLAPNNTEPLSYSLKLIIILKNVIFGHSAVLSLTFLKIKHFSIVNLKLIWKYLEGYSGLEVLLMYEFILCRKIIGQHVIGFLSF